MFPNIVAFLVSKVGGCCMHVFLVYTIKYIAIACVSLCVRSQAVGSMNYQKLNNWELLKWLFDPLLNHGPCFVITSKRTWTEPLSCHNLFARKQ